MTPCFISVLLYFSGPFRSLIQIPICVEEWKPFKTVLRGERVLTFNRLYNEQTQYHRVYDYLLCFYFSFWSDFVCSLFFILINSRRIIWWISFTAIVTRTGSIKPSLQHFQFCRVGLSLGILISLYFTRATLFVKEIIY
jgi:hypothetical protein